MSFTYYGSAGTFTMNYRNCYFIISLSCKFIKFSPLPCPINLFKKYTFLSTDDKRIKVLKQWQICEICINYTLSNFNLMGKKSLCSTLTNICSMFFTHVTQERDMHALTSPFDSYFYVICYTANDECGVLCAYKYLGTNLTLYYLDAIDLTFLSFLQHISYVIYLAQIVRIEQISAYSTVNTRSSVWLPKYNQQSDLSSNTSNLYFRQKYINFPKI